MVSQPVAVQRPPFSRCWIVRVRSQVTFFKGLTEIMARAKPRAPWLQTRWILTQNPNQLVKYTARYIFSSFLEVHGYCSPFCKPFLVFISICILWLMLHAVCSHVHYIYSQWVQGLWKGPSQQCSFPAMKSYPGNQRKSFHKNSHMLNWWSQYLLYRSLCDLSFTVKALN